MNSKTLISLIHIIILGRHSKTRTRCIFNFATENLSLIINAHHELVTGTTQQVTATQQTHHTSHITYPQHRSQLGIMPRVAPHKTVRCSEADVNRVTCNNVTHKNGGKGYPGTQPLSGAGMEASFDNLQNGEQYL